MNQRKLEEDLGELLQDGGEGIILQKPGSVYEHGKTQSLLKIKVHPTLKRMREIKRIVGEKSRSRRSCDCYY